MKEGHIVSDLTATLYYQSDVHTIDNMHPNFKRVVQALRSGDYQLSAQLMKPINMIRRLGQGFSVENDVVMHCGEAVDNLVCERIVDAVSNNQNASHLVNFLVKLRENPSYNSQKELYKFLEVNKLPISDNGDFVAYKRINENWTDCYTGKIDNRVGNLVIMPRQAVDDDSSHTCSSGLHICGFGYLRHFSGSRLIAVAVNPRDVVSVPHDYNSTKMRCCAYKVLEELDIALVENGRDILSENRRYHDFEEEAGY
jgi:hypothetical protein